MKPALHRSIIFWSGILVMGFIAWAWWDSATRVHHLRGGAWTAFSAQSAVVAFYNPRERQKFEVFREELSPENGAAPEQFPLPLIRRGQRFDDNFPALSKKGNEMTLRENWLYFLEFQWPVEWVIFLPHWLLLLGFALPWSALLAWRARRRSRALSAVG